MSPGTSLPKQEKHDANESDIPLTYDPIPPDSDADWNENTAYLKALDLYSSEKLIAFEEDENIQGREMWVHFKETFRKDAINALSRISLLSWRSLLLSRGVYVMRGQNDNESLAEALIECLNESDFVPLVTAEGSSHEKPDIQNTDFGSTALDGEKAFQLLTNCNVTSVADENSVLGMKKNFTQHDNTTDSLCTTSDGDGPFVELRTRNRLGISGLIAFYSNRPRYAGDPFDDLYGIAEVYKSLSGLCGLRDNEMIQGLPLILEGDAMMFFCRRLKDMRDFDQIVEALREEFTPESVRIDLLQMYQKTSLTKHMRRSPLKSELQVFRDVCRFLEATQKKLDKVYHSDIFLQDQILMATDIPELKGTFCYSSPESSRAAKKRIEKLLSCSPGSARRS